MEDKKDSLSQIVQESFNRTAGTIGFLYTTVKKVCLILSILFFLLFLQQIIVYMSLNELHMTKNFIFFGGFIFFIFFPYTSEFYVTWKEKKVSLLGKELNVKTGDLHVRDVPYSREVFWLKLEYDLHRVLTVSLLALVICLFVYFYIYSKTQ